MNVYKLVSSLLIVLCVSTISVSAEEEAITLNAVTIVDCTGKLVCIDLPVERIISLSARSSEIISAQGANDKIVGKSSSSTYPPILQDIKDVGASSYRPNVELIMELNPDVLIADGMLSDENRCLFEDAGIAVVVESFVDPIEVINSINNLGVITQKEDRSQEMTSFIQQYQNIIDERLSDLKPEERSDLFLEFLHPYQTWSSGSSYHELITTIGGYNIASEEPVSYPLVSAEWVVERNPEIIVRVESINKEPIEEDMKEIRDEILSRPGLSEIDAVKNNQAYVINSRLTGGVLSIVGELYLAKWTHPDLFSDIYPEQVHRELVEEFYGLEPEWKYVYP